MTMSNNRDGLCFLTMHQQNNHLTGAIVRAMIGAKTIILRHARSMQIECLLDLETACFESLHCPGNGRLSRLVQGQEGS